jgi:hypothetical protein
MIKLIIFHEKHGDHYFTYQTQEELYQIALHVFKIRFEEEWYESEDPSVASIINENNGKKAYSFLNKRSYWEYESFDLEDALTVNDLKV